MRKLVEETRIERAKSMGLHDIEQAVAEGCTVVYVLNTGNKYQAKPWFFEAEGGYFCSCVVAGMSVDSEDKQEVIDFLLKSTGN